MKDPTEFKVTLSSSTFKVDPAKGSNLQLDSDKRFYTNEGLSVPATTGDGEPLIAFK